MVYHWKSDIDTNVGIDILLGYISYDNVFQWNTSINDSPLMSHTLSNIGKSFFCCVICRSCCSLVNTAASTINHVDIIIICSVPLLMGQYLLSFVQLHLLTSLWQFTCLLLGLAVLIFLQLGGTGLIAVIGSAAQYYLSLSSFGIFIDAYTCTWNGRECVIQALQYSFNNKVCWLWCECFDSCCNVSSAFSAANVEMRSRFPYVLLSSKESVAYVHCIICLGVRTCIKARYNLSYANIYPVDWRLFFCYRFESKRYFVIVGGGNHACKIVTHLQCIILNVEFY